MLTALSHMTMARWTALAVFSLAVILLVMPAPAGWQPEFVTSLAFFALASLIAVAPPEVIFAGWASTAMWLTVGGLIVGIAVNRTGLGARLASRLTGLFGETYKAQVAAMVLVGVALSFFMPSTMGRVILLVPIALALADRLGATGARAWSWRWPAAPGCPPLRSCRPTCRTWSWRAPRKPFTACTSPTAPIC